MTDTSESFGELIGRSSTRGDERTIGTWIGSPTGRYVGRLTARQLRISPASNPLHLKLIATASTKKDSLGGVNPIPQETHVLWAPDESRLFYLESRAAPPSPKDVETYGAPLETRLYEVRPDGSGRRLVKRFRSPKFLDLLGFDARRGILYWIETFEGGFAANLTAVSVADGRTRLVDKLTPELTSSSVQLSPLADRAFVNQGRRVVEIDLGSGHQRTMYQTAAIDYVQWIRVSPDGGSIVLEEGMEAGALSVRLLTLKTGRSRVIYEVPDGQPPPAHWSPEGRYLVLDGEATCGTFVDHPNVRVLDVRRGRVNPLRVAQVECPREATDLGSPGLRFLAWLSS
jgi:hypothetical protein